jgi:hypothetical protein
MSTELRNQINDLAMKFAAQLMSALQAASLSELASEAAQGARRGPGRPPKAGALAKLVKDAGSAVSRGGKRRRRSAADIGETVEAIVKLLKTQRAGLRAEQIRAKLGLARKEIPRPIAAALASRKITKKGQKRATTYFAR